MLKKSRLFSLICVLCMLINVFAAPSYKAEASDTDSSIVRIQNMWNSSYMVNGQGTGKYSFSASDSLSVWILTPYDSSTYTIKNWDGTYLHASGDSVTCETMNSSSDTSFRWNIQSTGTGKYWITSAANPNKAINIENLTGSLQLTTYYESWESAKWIISEVSGPELDISTDNVIFRSASNDLFMHDGASLGNANIMQASIVYGNYLYKIIDKGDYCFIQYNQKDAGETGYLKSMGEYWLVDSSLDESSVNYRWDIQENSDGTVSIVSIASQGMCISSTGGTTLIDLSTAGDAGKWNMYSGNSFIIRIFNSARTHTLTAGGSNYGQAVFKYNGDSTPEGLDSQWQVIYNDGKMYLRNMLTGRYLCASNSDGDTLVYVKDYNASEDDLYVWEGNNLRYTLGLLNNNTYLHIDYQTQSGTDTVDLTASLPVTNGYVSINLDYEVVGFTQ